MTTRLPLIDASRCSGCGACIGACEPHILAFEQHGWRKLAVLLEESACTGCAKCQVRCWTGAIRMVRPQPTEPSSSSTSNHLTTLLEP